MKYSFLLLGVILSTLSLRTWKLNTPDFTLDELHYARDAARFFNRDPYMIPRHHTFQHPPTTVGHPFLHGLIVTVFMKIFGVSIFSIRLPSVISGISTVAILFLLARSLFSYKVASLTAWFAAIFPYFIRYDRTAFLDSLLSVLFGATILTSTLLIKTKKRHWFWTSGLFVALSLSTKYNGMFTFLIPPMAYFIYLTKSKPSLKNIIVDLSLFFIIIGSVFFLFNNPASYWGGLINPTEPAYKMSLVNQIQRLKLVPDFYLPVISDLISWPFLLLAFIGLIKIKNQSKYWLIATMFISFLFFIPNIPSFGTSRLMPMVYLLPLLASIGIFSLSKKIRPLVTTAISLLLIINSINFGLRYRKVTFPVKPINNFTILDTARQNVIYFLNQKITDPTNVYFEQSNYLPLFLAHDEIKIDPGYKPTEDFYAVVFNSGSPPPGDEQNWGKMTAFNLKSVSESWTIFVRKK